MEELREYENKLAEETLSVSIIEIYQRIDINDKF